MKQKEKEGKKKKQSSPLSSLQHDYEHEKSEKITSIMKKTKGRTQRQAIGLTSMYISEEVKRETKRKRTEGQRGLH